MLADQDVVNSRSITMSVIMTPDMANFIGNVHGGHLLCFLDKVAFACGAQYTSREVLTLSLDHVLFKQPVRISNLVTCYANINFIGRTSMEIGIRTEAKDLRTQEVRHVLSCFFTMVAVDDSSQPVPITPFKPETELEIRRWEDGQHRRQARHDLRKS